MQSVKFYSFGSTVGHYAHLTRYARKSPSQGASSSVMRIPQADRLLLINALAGPSTLGSLRNSSRNQFEIFLQPPPVNEHIIKVLKGNPAHSRTSISGSMLGFKSHFIGLNGWTGLAMDCLCVSVLRLFMLVSCTQAASHTQSHVLGSAFNLLMHIASPGRNPCADIPAIPVKTLSLLPPT